MPHEFASRDISDNVRRKLNVCMLKPEGEPLSPRVVDTYWRMKAACDRLSLTPTDHLLVMVVMAAGEMPEPVKPGVLARLRSGEVVRGGMLLVKIGKEWRGCNFDGIDGQGQIIVTLADGEIKRVPESAVRVPEPEAVTA